MGAEDWLRCREAKFCIRCRRGCTRERVGPLRALYGPRARRVRVELGAVVGFEQRKSEVLS